MGSCCIQSLSAFFLALALAVQPFLQLHKNVTEVQLMTPLSEGMLFRNLDMLTGLT